MTTPAGGQRNEQEERLLQVMAAPTIGAAAGAVFASPFFQAFTARLYRGLEHTFVRAFTSAGLLSTGLTPTGGAFRTALGVGALGLLNAVDILGDVNYRTLALRAGAIAAVAYPFVRAGSTSIAGQNFQARIADATTRATGPIGAASTYYRQVERQIQVSTDRLAVLGGAAFNQASYSPVIAGAALRAVGAGGLANFVDPPAPIIEEPTPILNDPFSSKDDRRRTLRDDLNQFGPRRPTRD